VRYTRLSNRRNLSSNSDIMTGLVVVNLDTIIRFDPMITTDLGTN
jgi:hypothetical protein